MWRKTLAQRGEVILAPVQQKWAGNKGTQAQCSKAEF